MLSQESVLQISNWEVRRDHSTTGDGLITTLLVLGHMVESGKSLAELRVMERMPQVLENVRVRERVPFLARCPK